MLFIQLWSLLENCLKVVAGALKQMHAAVVASD
jgi:hypothetical protein